MDTFVTPPYLQADNLSFPDIDTAQRERNGLVAIGGDLSIPRLLAAYRQGIFPWYDQHHPILWWAFAERMVLKMTHFHYNRSLRKNLTNRRYCITVDYAFKRVIRRCAHTQRPGSGNGTWLTREMQDAFNALHQQGFAHSFEYWYQPESEQWQLGGGLYGVLIGQIFFGESMFTHVSDASKITFVHAVNFLRELDVPLIDCQVHSNHLARFGAQNIPFQQFRDYLDAFCSHTTPKIQPSMIVANQTATDLDFPTTLITED